MSPPGTVQLDFTIRDSAGEMIDREQRTVTVPDLGKTTLALTTPVVSRARSASEFRSLSSGPSRSRSPAASSAAPIGCVLRVAPYGTASTDAEVTAQLVGPRGTTLAELPIHAEGEGGGFRLDLPLSSLATGEFLIAIAARTPARAGRSAGAAADQPVTFATLSAASCSVPRRSRASRS